MLFGLFISRLYRVSTVYYVLLVECSSSRLMARGSELVLVGQPVVLLVLPVHTWIAKAGNVGFFTPQNSMRVTVTNSN